MSNNLLLAFIIFISLQTLTLSFHLPHLLSFHHHHQKNLHSVSSKTAEPLKPIVSKPINNDQDSDTNTSSHSFQSGQWETSELCNQKSDNFKCQCRQGCSMQQQLTENTKVEACVCFDERICLEENQKTKEWEETETDSYKNQWSEDIKKCKAQQQQQ